MSVDQNKIQHKKSSSTSSRNVVTPGPRPSGLAHARHRLAHLLADR